MSKEAQHGGPAVGVAPVRHSITVPGTPEHAFSVYVERYGSWAPRDHHIGAVEMADVVIEPRVGGRWYEVGVDGSECDWGRVLAYEPPHRIVLAWQLDAQWRYDPELVTEVEVRFSAVEGGTLVELEHRNLERYGAAAEQVRSAIDSDGGWPRELRLFAAAV